MNNKGFTLIEVIVTIAIRELLQGLRMVLLLVYRLEIEIKDIKLMSSFSYWG